MLVAKIATPETLLAWHRKLIADTYDGSAQRKPGRPRIESDVETLVVRMAQENRTRGYKRIAGASDNLGHVLSASTIANILKRHGIEPAPERARKTTWKEFIFRHFDPIVATDFFTVEAWKKRGLQRFVVLFFIDLSSRRVELGGIGKSPSGLWMERVGRNITDGEAGILKAKRYLIHDRDRLYTAQFRAILKDSRMESVKLSRRSPNLNAFAEGLVRSIKGVLGPYHSFRRRALRTAVREYLAHDLGDNEFGRCLGRAVGANRCRRDRITGAVRFGVEWGSRYGDVTLGRLGPSIFTAIQEQMGLRLESARGPLEVLVVDSVSKPSEN